MLSLTALAGWEMAVLGSIRGASGGIEERDAQITRSGIYAEYPAIFTGYLDLVLDALTAQTTALTPPSPVHDHQPNLPAVKEAA